MKSKVTGLLTHGDSNIRVAATAVTQGKISAFPNPNSKKPHWSGHQKLPTAQKAKEIQEHSFLRTRP